MADSLTVAWLVLAVFALVVGALMTLGHAAVARRAGYTPLTLALIAIGAAVQGLYRGTWPLQLLALLVPIGALMAFWRVRRARPRKPH